MGIDTVKLRSPAIDEGTAEFLERQCVLRQGIDLASGEVLYEITAGELNGSWDSRIMFRVMRQEWATVGGRLDLYPCQPYILLEFSLHKFFYGQNVYGSVVGFRDRCALAINLIAELLESDADLFPRIDLWTVRRVDWAEMYRLSPAAIAEFFRSISHAKFPRRGKKAAKYGTNAVYFPGKFTTLKLYHKGPEFKEHDHARMKRVLMAYAMKQVADHKRMTRGGALIDSSAYSWIDRKLRALQRLADNRLRVETEIHADKLQHDFKGFPTVAQMTDDYMQGVHDAEVFKLLKEGKADMETVRTHDAVKARLDSVYGPRRANSLWAFWLQLATRGEDVTMQAFSKSQFYANRKSLVDAGVSWLASDVFILPQQTALPHDFKPLRADPRRCGAPISNDSVFNVCPVDFNQVLRAA